LKTHFVIITILLIASACSKENILTQEDIRVQNLADYEVATILFNHDMTTTASYHVRKDGFVIIKFDESVKFDTYNALVKRLRANLNIRGVRAEQSGKEVCPQKF